MDEQKRPGLTAQSEALLPTALCFPSHPLTALRLLGARGFMQQLPGGHVRTHLGVGLLGKTALGGLPLNPNHSCRPAGCQQLLVAGGE